METNMKRAMLVTLISAFALSSALAQEPTCESKAVSKNGKPLFGAVKTKKIQKCKRETCEAKALDKNGDKMKGIVKKNFMAECEKNA
jgi:hypothetical protein